MDNFGVLIKYGTFLHCASLVYSAEVYCHVSLL